MTEKLTVAVIGTGNIGTAIATNLVKGNCPVLVADRTLEKATTLAQHLGNLARPSDIPGAIKEANIIIFAIWFDAIRELFNTYATALQGKIIVDPSNPIAPDEKGGFKKTIGENESAGELLKSLLPKDAILVKALGTLGVASLSGAAFQKPEAAVLFYAADDESVQPVMEQLIRDNGFEPICVGGIDQSIRLEVFGDLHEFGALGKTVTVSEAKTKL
jgi:hypothetical protein